MLLYRHKQFLTLFAALVIVLVQYTSVVHAADHLFHQEDVLCVSLQSTELDKHFFHGAPHSLYNADFISELVTLLTESVPPSLYSFYLSRAPPATAV